MSSQDQAPSLLDRIELMWSTVLLAAPAKSVPSCTYLDTIEKSASTFIKSLFDPKSISNAATTQNARSLTSVESSDELTDRKNFGFSHKQCKILAPYLTYYRLCAYDMPERPRNRSHKLYIEEHPESSDEPGFYDCGRIRFLRTCAFSVDPGDVMLPGIGQDSALKNTSEETGYGALLDRLLRRFSYLQEQITGHEVKQLVPLFVEGDGNCLAHSISRCLIGSQILFHALRTNLQHRLRCDKDKYQQHNSPKEPDSEDMQSCDYYLGGTSFGNDVDYKKLLDAAPPLQPSQEPTTGFLGPEHLFCFANMLRRPILLVDANLNSNPEPETFCLFFPLLHGLDSQDIVKGTRHLLVVAWQNNARNHFVPLVPVRGERVLIHYSALPKDADDLPFVFGLLQDEKFNLPKQSRDVKKRWLKHYTVTPRPGKAASSQPCPGSDEFFEVGGYDTGEKDVRKWQQLHKDVERNFQAVWAEQHGGAQVTSVLVNRFCRPLLAASSGAGGGVYPAHDSAVWAILDVLEKYISLEDSSSFAGVLKAKRQTVDGVQQLLRGGGRAEQTQLLELVTSFVQVPSPEEVEVLRFLLGERRVIELWDDCWVMGFPAGAGSATPGRLYHSLTMTKAEAQAVWWICGKCNWENIVTTAAPRRGICGITRPENELQEVLRFNMTTEETLDALVSRAVPARFAPADAVPPPWPAAAAGVAEDGSAGLTRLARKRRLREGGEEQAGETRRRVSAMSPAGSGPSESENSQPCAIGDPAGGDAAVADGGSVRWEGAEKLLAAFKEGLERGTWVTRAEEVPPGVTREPVLALRCGARTELEAAIILSLMDELQAATELSLQ